MTLTGPNAPDFTLSNGCGATLTTGANCTVQVAVDASATGTRKAYLSVTSNSPASPQYVTLTSTSSVGAGIATLSASNYVFADSGLTHDFTLTNTGNAFLTFNSATTLTSLFSTTNTCGTGLAAGASCVISATNLAPADYGLNPTNPGSSYDQLSVSTSDTTSPQSVFVTSNSQGRTILPSNIVFPPSRPTLPPPQRSASSITLHPPPVL